jgi:uncharacterized protein (TIGR02466 family)
MLVKLDADRSVIFGTPIFVRKSFLEPAANEDLEKAVRARAAAEQGVLVSNVGGWQSQANFFDWQEPEVTKLGAELDRTVEQFVFFGRQAAKNQKELKLWKAGWANINRAGDYNILHNHPGQDLAAIYYVKAKVTNGTGGHLELRDPRQAAAFSNFPKLSSAGPLQLAPEPGMLVMFPSWVEHMVHPHHGAEDRISIAVNIKLMDFDG